MVEGFYSKATALRVESGDSVCVCVCVSQCPTDKAVPNRACVLDRVLTDCGVLGAKTPK